MKTDENKQQQKNIRLQIAQENRLELNEFHID